MYQASGCSPEKEIANIINQGNSRQDNWMSHECHSAPEGNPTLVQYGGGDAFFLQHWLMLGFGAHQFCIISFEEMTSKDQRAMDSLGSCLGTPIPAAQLPDLDQEDYHPPSTGTNVSAAFQNKLRRYQLKWLCVLGSLLDREGL